MADTEERVAEEENAGEKAAGGRADAGKADATLEQRIEAAKPAVPEQAESKLKYIILAQQILPLEQYIVKFTQRYEHEKTFRELVHDYLWIKKTTRLGLSIGRRFRTKGYKKKSTEIIKRYASEYMQDLYGAMEIERAKEEAEKQIQELEEQKKTWKETQAAAKAREADFQQAEGMKLKKVEEVQQQFQRRKEDLEYRTQQKVQEIAVATDSRRIAGEVIRQKILQSDGLKQDEWGNYVFDNEAMTLRLGEVFLARAVEEIEAEEGMGKSFISRSQNAYKQAISHFAELEFPEESSEVDWVATAINAASQGHRIPLLRHYIVAKFKEEKPKCQKITTINFATAIDWSYSMAERNNRYVVAKEAGLAGHAYMHKMNPDNASFCCVWNGTIGTREGSFYELYQMQDPDDGTPMDIALHWLIEKLGPLGAGIANLVTDGEPNELNVAIRAARKFRDYPALRLRIFLIDPSPESESAVRKIGQAAGPGTGVCCIPVGDLTKTSIKELYKSIGELRNIEEF